MFSNPEWLDIFKRTTEYIKGEEVKDLESKLNTYVKDKTDTVYYIDAFLIFNDIILCRCHKPGFTRIDWININDLEFGKLVK